MAATAENITAIRSSARDPLRCTVMLGRRAAAKLSREAVERLGLRVGMLWDAATESRIRDAEAEELAMRYAMRVVRRRAIGSAELIERLTRKGHAAAAPFIVQRLTEKGMLDDEKYGRLVVQSELARKPTGRRLLTHKLYRKRLPRELIGRVVEQAVRQTDPVADARRLVEQKLRGATLRRCDSRTRHRRLWGVLARRGFDYETIEAALRDQPGLRNEAE